MPPYRRRWFDFTRRLQFYQYIYGRLTSRLPSIQFLGGHRLAPGRLVLLTDAFERFREFRPATIGIRLLPHDEGSITTRIGPLVDRDTIEGDPLRPASIAAITERETGKFLLAGQIRVHRCETLPQIIHDLDE